MEPGLGGASTSNPNHQLSSRKKKASSARPGGPWAEVLLKKKAAPALPIDDGSIDDIALGGVNMSDDEFEDASAVMQSSQDQEQPPTTAAAASGQGRGASGTTQAQGQREDGGLRPLSARTRGTQWGASGGGVGGGGERTQRYSSGSTAVIAELQSKLWWMQAGLPIMCCTGTQIANRKSQITNQKTACNQNLVSRCVFAICIGSRHLWCRGVPTKTRLESRFCNIAA